MKRKTFLLFFSSCSLFILFSCKKQEGPAGLKSLVNLVAVPAGIECENGGIKIETGIDNNGNNLLDSNEVTDFQSVCNGVAGTNGYSSLVRTSPIASSVVCNAGGLQIETGIDSNANGVLEDAEVQQTQQLCNGANGTYDKQIAIVLYGLGGGLGANRVTPFVYQAQTVSFNIDNFTGVDSAVFVVGSASVFDAGNTVHFKLVDITDNTVFENSHVYTNSVLPLRLTSANIFNDLPKKNIDFGLQLYVDEDGLTGQGLFYYLVLNRK